MNVYKNGLVRLQFLPAVYLITVFSMGTAAADLPDALTAGWKGQKTCEKLFEDDKVRVVRCTFPPVWATNVTSIPRIMSMSWGQGGPE